MLITLKLIHKIKCMYSPWFNKPIHTQRCSLVAKRCKYSPSYCSIPPEAYRTSRSPTLSTSKDKKDPVYTSPSPSSPVSAAHVDWAKPNNWPMPSLPPSPCSDRLFARVNTHPPPLAFTAAQGVIGGKRAIGFRQDLKS